MGDPDRGQLRANFNEDVHIGWRLSAGELRKRAGARKERAAM